MGFKPTCSEVHRLTSEAMDRPLSRRERLRVGLHLLVCRACRRFGEQAEMIRRAMRQTPRPKDEP